MFALRSRDFQYSSPNLDLAFPDVSICYFTLSHEQSNLELLLCNPGLGLASLPSFDN